MRSKEVRTEATRLEKHPSSLFAMCVLVHVRARVFFPFKHIYLLFLFFFKAGGWGERSQGEAGTSESRCAARAPPGVDVGGGGSGPKLSTGGEWGSGTQQARVGQGCGEEP